MNLNGFQVKYSKNKIKRSTYERPESLDVDSYSMGSGNVGGALDDDEANDLMQYLPKGIMFTLQNSAI